MNKYEVCIDYTATKLYVIEAEDADQAESMALQQAQEVAPYDDLVVTVGYVDEYENLNILLTDAELEDE